MARKLTARQQSWQGGKWIRPERRLAIYLRDGLACVYCGSGVEDGAQLSLDHVHPHSHGGGNETTNLVTACRRCNSSRGNRSVAAFAKAVAKYLDMDSRVITRRVARQCQRPADTATAKELLARRGTLTAAIRGKAGR